jgi:hypothetical protein
MAMRGRRVGSGVGRRVRLVTTAFAGVAALVATVLSIPASGDAGQTSGESTYIVSDPTGNVWNGSVWTGIAWNGSVWNGSIWNGSVWNGSIWNGSVWNGSIWN